VRISIGSGRRKRLGPRCDDSARGGVPGKIAAHDHDGPGDITGSVTPFTKNVTLFREGGPRSKVVTVQGQCAVADVRIERLTQ
jgi:hypothetical protein